MSEKYNIVMYDKNSHSYTLQTLVDLLSPETIHISYNGNKTIYGHIGDCISEYSKIPKKKINHRCVWKHASENIYLNAKKNIKTESGADTEMVAGADFTADATKEIFINGGGAVGIHCESEVIHTSSGLDEFMAPDFYQDVTPFHDESIPSLSKIDSYNNNDD